MFYTYIEASDIAGRLGVDIDTWDDPTISKASALIEETTVFISAITNMEFSEDDTVPDRIRTAVVSIAARRFLERTDNISKFRLGDYSEDYVDPGTFASEDLTSFERQLLSPWLTNHSGIGQINVGPAFGDSTRYVPVADTAENFPLYEV